MVAQIGSGTRTEEKERSKRKGTREGGERRRWKAAHKDGQVRPNEVITAVDDDNRNFVSGEGGGNLLDVARQEDFISRVREKCAIVA